MIPDFRLAAIATATMLLACPAVAQDALPGEAPASEQVLESAPDPAAETATDAATISESLAEQADETVIVRGRRLSEIEFDLRIYIQDFIEEIAAPARSRGLARWHRNVCIGIHNLAAEPAQFIADRISALALDVGLQPGEPGCNPNVNIMFATNAAESARLMVDNDPAVFRPVGGSAGMDLGLEALDYFVETDRPVRWWQVSMPVDERTGAPAIEAPAASCFRLHCYPVLAAAGPSRLYSAIRDDMKYMIIIVDATQLRRTSWLQIADYLAMVSLAQINPWTDPDEFDSILNLFRNPGAYSGLTDWDMQYLLALYQFDQRRDTRIQANEIVSRIAELEMAENP